jgi:nucleoside phosphorylase
VSRAVDVLVVAAFPPELAPLSPPLILGDVVTHRDRTVACDVIGIGLARASAGLARALERFTPRAVVLIGSCGLYPNAPGAIPDVLVARSVTLVDAAALEQRAQFPAPLPTERICDAPLVAGLEQAGARPARVGNTLAITTDDPLASRYSAAGLHAEHLEAFALDAVPAAVSCTAVLAVANRVGSGARDEWKANAGRAHQALASVMRRWLDAGTPGVT